MPVGILAQAMNSQWNSNRRGKNGPRAAGPPVVHKSATVARRQRRKKQKKVGRKVQSKTKASGAMFCPDIYSRHWACHVHRSTPYTVVKERIVTNIATNTSEDNVVLLGPIFSLSADQNTSTVGCRGLSGSNTTAAIAINSTKLPVATYGSKVRCRLHRFSVTVTCDGNAVGAVPAGHIYAGTLNGPLDVTSFTTFGDLVTYLQTVNQVHGRSAKSCCDKPMRLATHPLDQLDWSQFRILNATNPTNPTRFADTLGPIAIVIKKQAAPSGVLAGDYSVNWTITMHCEWCVIFGNDAILQSTHTYHPPASPSLVDAATRAAQNVGGFLAGAGSMLQGAESALEAGASIARRAGVL